MRMNKKASAANDPKFLLVCWRRRVCGIIDANTRRLAVRIGLWDARSMGGKKMKMLLNIAAALVFVSSCALAADNLACTGPFGEISGAPNFTKPSGHLDPGQVGWTCPQILSTDTVSAVACFVEIAVPPQPPTSFRCPVAASCPGVGTFQSIERIKGPMGSDQICATYINQGGNTETYGIHLTVKH